MKKIILLAVLFLLNCAKAPDKAVVWSPLEPKENEEIIVDYFPQAKDALIKNPQELVLICQITYPDTEVLKIVPMEKKGSTWQGRMKLEEKAYLLSFKFEDKKGRTDDNDGSGWNLIVRTGEGKVPMGAYFAFGKSFEKRYEVQEGPQEALKEYQKELELYPENYRALRYKWGTELGLSKEPEKLKNEIKTQTDSLLKIHPDDPQVLSLGYSVYSYSLNDRERGMAFGERFVKNFPKEKDAANVAYFMIYQKFGNDSKSQIKSLENYVNKFPNSEEAKYAYFDLGSYYQGAGQTEKARQMYKKFLGLAPGNITVFLTWANLEKGHKNYDEAEKLIKEALSFCTLEAYRTSLPWYTYEHRLAFRKDDLAQIYASFAELEFEKGNYKKSLENWEKALAQAPRRTSTIWAGLGKTYQNLQDRSKAKGAYLQALLSNPEETEAKDSLFSLYKDETGNEKGFEEYLQKEILSLSKSSAASAPDFEAIDLTGKKLKLSQVKGKVVVLYFWATWCGSCQYLRPQNNELFDQFKDNPEVAFWAVSSEGQGAIENYLQKNEFKYHQFYGGKKVLNLYGSPFFPTHLVIDKKGFIRFKYIGPLPGLKEKLAEDINSLLSERT